MAARTVTWLGQYCEDGVVYFRLGRDGEELVAEWPSIATLRANPLSRTSHFEAAPDADPELVDKVHRSLARALLRQLEQKLTLHGSAVCVGDRSIAIVGSSGSGKSTLAAALAQLEGVAFVADDTLAVEMSDQEASVSLLPTEVQSWLLPDACTALGIEAADDKRAVAPLRLAGPSRLTAILVPEFREDSAVVLTRARGVAMLSALVPAVVRFIIDEPRVHLREMEQLTKLTNAVPMYVLARPRELASLFETVRVVRELFNQERQ